MHAEAKILKHTALSFDHIILEAYVVRIQDHWFDGFSLADLLDVGEYIDDIPDPPRWLCLLYLAGEADTTHGNHLH